MVRTLLLLLSSSILASCGARNGPPDAGLPDVGDKVPAEVQDILAAPDSFEVMALHPFPHDEEGQPGPEDEVLDDYKILGQAALTDQALQRRVVGLVYQGILESEGMVAACFNPRHGIRARKGTQEVAVVICYECLSLQIHGPGKDQVTNVLTHEGVEPAVSRIWRDQGLAIHRDQD